MTTLHRPIILIDGKKKLYRPSDGFLLGGLNFSYKRVTGSIQLEIPQYQQMIVMQDLQVDAGSDIQVGNDSELVIIGDVA